MMIWALLLSHILLHSARAHAAPLEAASNIHRRDVATTTVDISAVQETGTPHIPVELLTDYDPVDGASFFYINHLCRGDTRNIDPNGPFKDRYDYLLQAIKDATTIADAARAWPQFHTDASDLYFGKGTESSQYAQNIIDNIKAAATWENPSWGFDPYITITCDDPFRACNGKIGGDPRTVAAYVNNTEDLWSTISKINCCGPFFTVPDIDQVHNDNLLNDDLDLQKMRTSGTFLLHEIMHAVKITQDRPRVRDQVFLLGKRRIYGAPDVAKAARTEGLDITTLNADSYALFATAIFWKDIYNKLPQPLSANADATDIITDNDNNYVDQVLPDPTPTCAGQPTDKPSATAAYVQRQIGAYCTHVASSGWIVNSTTGVYGPIGYAAGDSAPASDNDLWISVSFDPLCNANVSYPVDLNACQKYLGIALNGCNTDSTTAKWGGQVEANCALWNITTRAGHNETPPNGYPPLA